MSDAHILGSLMQGAMLAAMPLLLAGMGELISERAGVINLGVEGTMLVGAAVSFVVMSHSHSLALSMLAGVAAGMTLGALFGLFAISLLTSQIPTGMAITAIGMGLSSYLGKLVEPQPLAPAQVVHIPILSKLPVVGEALFSLPPMAYIAIAMCVTVWWFFTHTRAGLAFRAVGDSPVVARQVGFPVTRVRYASVIFGAGLYGLAGAYYCANYVLLWQENMVAGRGWLAIALVMFAGWRPLRLMAGALLFGALTAVQFQTQTMGLNVPSQLLTVTPYLATIIVLTFISARGSASQDVPRSLGKTFHPLLSKLM